MKKFSNYDDIEANEFVPTEKLTPGPHLCVIKDAVEVSYKRKDGTGEFPMLNIRFDITGDEELAGFYDRKYKRKIEEAEKEGNDVTSVRYEGIYRLSIPVDDGSEQDEKTKVNFKTVITAIEKSNKNYTFDFEEKTLIGKIFCGVFGIEEFENSMTGETLYSTKCRFIRSTENMDKITIPKVKLIDKTYIEYEDWLKQKEAEKNGTSVNTTTEFTVSEEDDSLPF